MKEYTVKKVIVKYFYDTVQVKIYSDDKFEEKMVKSSLYLNRFNANCIIYKIGYRKTTNFIMLKIGKDKKSSLLLSFLVPGERIRFKPIEDEHTMPSIRQRDRLEFLISLAAKDTNLTPFEVLKDFEELCGIPYKDIILLNIYDYESLSSFVEEFLEARGCDYKSEEYKRSIGAKNTIAYERHCVDQKKCIICGEEMVNNEVVPLCEKHLKEAESLGWEEFFKKYLL